LLRIHIEELPGITTIRLEGKLIHPWTDELSDTWMRLKARTGEYGTLRIDLDAVSFVDERGKITLGTLHRTGCELSGSGPFISALIDEVTGPSTV
jgi:hypothetical protein